MHQRMSEDLRLTWPRQAVARAEEGIPTDGRPQIVRKEGSRTCGDGCRQGQGEGDEG